MTELKSRTELVPANFASLERAVTTALVKRGLGDLHLLESAAVWLKKAKEAKSQNRLADFFECLKRAVASDPE